MSQILTQEELTALLREDNSENSKKEIQQYLLDCEISEKNTLILLDELEKEINVEKFKDRDFILEYLTMKISKQINIALPFDVEKSSKVPFINAFIGATGVGKTSTIAKLSAHFALVKKKKLVLFTTDTYRMCGFEQLKTYGDILEIDTVSVLNKDDFKNALEKYSDKDMIFVDTAGISPYNSEEILKMKYFLDDDKIKKSLLISANSSFSEMMQIFKRYSSVGFDNVILSKVDEAGLLGNIYNFLVDSGASLSYITCGQTIPEDIYLPEKIKLASSILHKHC